MQISARLQRVIDHFVSIEPLGFVLHLDRVIYSVVVESTKQVVRMPKVLGNDLTDCNVIEILITGSLTRFQIDVQKVLGNVPVSVDQIVHDVFDHEILVFYEP